MFREQRANMHERTVGRAGRLRVPSDLHGASRKRQMRVQGGSCLHIDRGNLCRPRDIGHVLARCADLLVSVVGHDLLQRSVFGRGWRGFVLQQHVYHWDEPVSVEDEPAKVRDRRQRVHRLLDLDLHRRRVYGRDWPGRVLR